MKSCFGSRVLTIIFAVLFCFRLSVWADTPFRFSAQAIPPQVSADQEFIIVVKAEIAQDHYLFAGDLLTLTPEPYSGLIFEPLLIPVPIQRQDPWLGLISIYAESLTLELPVKSTAEINPGVHDIWLNVTYQGCSKGLCFMPEEIRLKVPVIIGADDAGAVPMDVAATQTTTDVMIFDPESTTPVLEDIKPVPDTKDESLAGSQEEILGAAETDDTFAGLSRRFGLLGVLAAAFLWGFLASLTPCVYPMIPITIGVIGASSAGNMRRGFMLSVFYVLGMSLTYALFGLIAAISGTLFGEHTNHPAVRIIVAGVFIALGLSMFGLFMLQLPASLQTRLGRYSGSGIIGIFITGAVAGCIIGPCVGPLLLGLLVYIATLGSKLQGFLIMWSFAAGMGMLFLIIGTFSGMASALPKAGNWMELIKRFFGLVFFGIALYYLEPIIGEQVFQLLTGAFFIALGLFFFILGKTEDGSLPDIRLLWKTLSLVLITIGICYVARFALTGQANFSISGGQQATTGIDWFSSESAALETAIQAQKPIMIDFRADWCADCIKLERETFSHPSVIEASRRFVCLKLDLTDSRSPTVRNWQQKYQIKGLPTILFFDNQGQRLPAMTITGFIPPHEMQLHLKQIP